MFDDIIVAKHNKREKNMKTRIFAYTDEHLHTTRYVDDHPVFKDYNLHKHNGYEILFLIKGEMYQLIEGTRYEMTPLDLILVRNDEFHQLFLEDKEYDRIVIQISKEFFAKYECEELARIFEERKAGTGNLIRKEQIMESGLYDCITRLQSYILAKPQHKALINGVLAELLYMLNGTNIKDDAKESRIREIIDFINNSYTKDITLEKIADKFFISKEHLCRKFKKETGFTINRYITDKRILKTISLYKEGKTLSEACIEAGFPSYSAFYKAYTKDTGISPLKGILKKP